MKLQFPQLLLNFDSSSNSFYSDTVHNIVINDFIDLTIHSGWITIQDIKNQNSCRLFIKNEEWFYMDFKRQLLQVLSSDDRFNNKLKDVSSNKRKFKCSDGKIFMYLLSTPRRKEDYKKFFEKLITSK
ncbi:MAG: hypothetical protein MRY83_22915 [Flavobacteriales bacterium]|nr:hypothetical protein [Flavobacteriales bacterium]